MRIGYPEFVEICNVQDRSDFGGYWKDWKRRNA